MICVECNNPKVESCYKKYKGEYIKLTVCSRCSQVVDKYIEYDNVLLFLDILLSKPQAYRHLCYNAIETRMTLVPGVKNCQTPIGLDFKRFMTMFGQLIRLIVIMILFEVYLLWAYEEKKSQHSLTMGYILSQDISIQYLSFILQLVMNHLIFNVLMQLMFFTGLGWNKLHNDNINLYYQTIYHQAVLLMGVLVANCIKLLPILMLIWPYDKTLYSLKIVAIISVFNIIEALNNISNIGYIKIILVFSLCSMLQNVISNSIFAGIIAHSSDYNFIDVFKSNYEDILWYVHEFH